MIRLFLGALVVTTLVASLLHLGERATGWLFGTVFILAAVGTIGKLKCQWCGKRVKIGASVCHHCGRDVESWVERLNRDRG